MHNTVYTYIRSKINNTDNELLQIYTDLKYKRVNIGLKIYAYIKGWQCGKFTSLSREIRFNIYLMGQETKSKPAEKKNYFRKNILDLILAWVYIQ